MGLFSKKTKPSQAAYAVVTGAGSGIGRSFALELGRRGGTVVCADINLAAAEETVSLLAQQGATRRNRVCGDLRCRRGRTSQATGRNCRATDATSGHTGDQ